MVQWGMKNALPCVLVLSIACACSEKPKDQAAPVPVDPMTRSAAGAYHRSKEAGAAANIDSIRTAIKAFHAANDRYPASLDEIKSFVGSDIDLGPYTYDPLTGSVTIKTP
ncbi:MAG: hypothetical protein OHK006_01680 [Thermodesulfovibrionales bacterium]